MNRFLNMLLALIVFACPMWCAMGNCCGSDNIKEASKSCCCEMPQENDIDPTPTSPQPQKPRQCICGGAVLADLFQLEHCDVWVALFLPVMSEYRFKMLSVPSETTDHPRNSFAISGRMLRLMHDCWTV